jgi:MoxR-like ATPase
MDVDMSIFEMARATKKPANDVVDPANPTGLTKEEIKRFTPNIASFHQTIDMFETIFRNMKNKKDTTQFPGVLLDGDPGVGKTTRMELFSQITGIQMITIETPHLVEEHIINIPFIVFKPSTNQKEGGISKIKDKEINDEDYDIVLADSNLYSKMKNAIKTSDKDHLINIYKQSKDIIALYEALGGTPTELPDDIKEVRDHFKVILFLDEYWRQTSERIRNMLRGVLNNKMGVHDIPNYVYFVYASNTKDEGLDPVPKNVQFKQPKVEAPSKEEWFSWFVLKFEENHKVKLNHKLIDRFHHILQDHHMSYQDEQTKIRTSPRRWEQLLLYINSSLPAKNEEDARSLLTNVATNFRDYESGQYSDLTKKVLEATATLIKETSHIDIEPLDINSSSAWRKTLEHQLEQKIKLGEYRKYVPILSGPHGVGKTAQAEAIAHKLNLRYIHLHADTLQAEDVLGLALPKTNKKDNSMETQFSLPALYSYVMQKIKAEDEAYIEKIKKEDNYKELKKQYDEQPAKYLIFFDEFNRNKAKVFNALRRVVLEKNFGVGNDGKLMTLPKEAIVAGAINPDDIGTHPFTHHMKDVLDIIHTTGHWGSQVEFMKNHVKSSRANELEHDLALQIITRFADKFHTKDPDVALEERPFHYDLGTDIYIAPREFSSLYKNVTGRLHDELKKIYKLDFQSMSSSEQAKIETNLRKKIFDEFKTDLAGIFFKNDDFDASEFMADVEEWIVHSPDIDFGENLFYKKALDVKKSSLIDIIGDHLDGKATTNAHKNQDFINFMMNVDLSKFREDMTDVAASRLKDKKSAEHYILDETHDQKVLKDGTMVVDPTAKKVSLLENFMLEIAISLHIHEMSNDKIEAIQTAIFTALEHFLESEKEALGEDLHDSIVRTLVNTILAVQMVMNDFENN